MGRAQVQVQDTPFLDLDEPLSQRFAYHFRGALTGTMERRDSTDAELLQLIDNTFVVFIRIVFKMKPADKPIYIYLEVLPGSHHDIYNSGMRATAYNS